MNKKRSLQIPCVFISFIFMFSLFLPSFLYATKIMPGYLEGPIMQGSLTSLLQDGHYKQAKNKIETRLKSDPDNYRLLLMLGYADVGLKNWAAADESIQKAILYAPQHKKDEVRVDLGNFYLLQENFVKAQSIYEKVLSKRPENSRALFNLGYLYQQSGEKSKAHDYYTRILQIDSRHKNSIKALVQLHMQEGHYEEIIPLARQLQSVVPDQEIGYYFEAFALTRQVKPNYLRAIELLHKAMDKKPESTQVLFTLGYAYFNNGQYDKALDCLEEATRIDPKFFEAHKLLAFTALKQNKLSMALNHLKKALSIKNSPELSDMFGKVSLQLEQEKTEVDTLTKSLKNASPVLVKTNKKIKPQNNHQNSVSANNKQRDSQSIYTIQIGSFLKVERAQKQFDSMLQILNGKEFSFLRIEKIGEYYCVRLGKFTDSNAAKQFIVAAKSNLSNAVVLEAYIKEERIIRFNAGSVLVLNESS